jgi:hypothetical protein
MFRQGWLRVRSLEDIAIMNPIVHPESLFLWKRTCIDTEGPPRPFPRYRSRAESVRLNFQLVGSDSAVACARLVQYDSGT